MSPDEENKQRPFGLAVLDDGIKRLESKPKFHAQDIEDLNAIIECLETWVDSATNLAAQSLLTRAHIVKAKI